MRVLFLRLDQRHVVVSMELKGPDNSLRVRQIRVLGEVEGESLKVGKQLSAQTIQQRNCEAETLKVFRLITSQVSACSLPRASLFPAAGMLLANVNCALQVFGKLIQGEKQQQTEPTEGANEDVEDSNDLREHMVGILFSRSNLTHLQKQVCTHIVQAIRKETVRMREEWETLLFSPTPANSLLSDNSDQQKATDTYCFEMLSMVLALSGSSVGQYYLSHQIGLLKDLLSLLHTGSARVQRQVRDFHYRITNGAHDVSHRNVLYLLGDVSLETYIARDQARDVSERHKRRATAAYRFQHRVRGEQQPHSAFRLQRTFRRYSRRVSKLHREGIDGAG